MTAKDAGAQSAAKLLKGARWWAERARDRLDIPLSLMADAEDADALRREARDHMTGAIAAIDAAVRTLEGLR